MKYKYYLKFISKLIFSRTKFATEIKESIFEIDFSAYKDLKLIIFDFDDTLSFHLGKLENDSLKLLDNLKDKGFKIAVYSNCKIKRNEELVKMLTPLDIYNVNRSTKPDPVGYLEVMKHYGIKPKHTMMVGDRLGTDIYGAFLSQIKHRILVKPYSLVFGGNKPTGSHYFVKNLEVKIYKFTRNLG